MTMTTNLMTTDQGARRSPPRAHGDEAIIRRIVERIADFPHPTIVLIQTITAHVFNRPRASILARGEDATNVKARYMAMALCRHYLGRASVTAHRGTVSYIARKFERDRTAVRAAVKRYAALVALVTQDE